LSNYDPYAHAEQLGIRVIRRRLTTGTGLWVPDQNVIFLQDRMRRVHDRSTLAHEIGTTGQSMRSRRIASPPSVSSTASASGT
jgi:hypothetical protein